MKISSLFNIGKNTERLTGKENIFFEDQYGARRHLLSREIDVVYEEEQQLQEEQRQEERELEEEIDFDNVDAKVLQLVPQEVCSGLVTSR